MVGHWETEIPRPISEPESSCQKSPIAATLPPRPADPGPLPTAGCRQVADRWSRRRPWPGIRLWLAFAAGRTETPEVPSSGIPPLGKLPANGCEQLGSVMARDPGGGVSGQQAGQLVHPGVAHQRNHLASSSPVPLRLQHP